MESEYGATMTDSEFTRLLLAIAAGELSAVHALIEKHWDLDQIGSNWMSPMMCAAFGGHSQLLRVLVSAGADVIPGADEFGTK